MSKFVGIKTYERFRSLWENNDIDEFSLNFILDTGQLYTHGVFINSAVFGTAANGAVLLSIAGTTNTLALSSHTHSNYYDKSENLDITNHKIISGDNDLLFCSGGALYIGNINNPTYISGSTIQSIKGLNTYTILDTENFSISNTLPTGYTHNNTAYIEYGGNSFLIDYVKRVNTSLSFDYLNSYTLAGTNLLNGDYYGYINFTVDNVYNNPAWAQLRINITGRSIQYRTSADVNNWINLGIPSIPLNALNVAGIVSAPNINTQNKVWKTDENGNPGWRDERIYSFASLVFQQIAGTELESYNTLTLKTILAGSNISFSCEDNVITINALDTTYSAFTGASANNDGSSGLVTAPNVGLHDKFLRGDGTWNTPLNTWRPIYLLGTAALSNSSTYLNIAPGNNISLAYAAPGTETGLSGNVNYATLTISATNTWIAWEGATETDNGTAGYMPAPTSALRNLFLRGDGTWISLNDYTLPTATNLVLGGIKVGTTLEDVSGYTAIHIKDDVAYYKDTTYSFSNLLFLLTSGTNLMTYNSQAARTILAGSNITFTHSNNILTIAATDTTYSTVSKTAAGLCPILPNETTTTKYLRLDGTWVTPPNDNTWTDFTGATASAAGTKGVIQAPAGAQNKFFRGDNTWLTISQNVTSALYVGASNGTGNSAQSTNGNVYLIFAEGPSYSRYKISGSGRASVTSDASGNITINSSGYSNFGAATASAAGSAGLVPAPGANVLGSAGYYLRADGTWLKPPNDNTWNAMTGATSSANGTVGYVNATPPKDGYNTKFLRADGTWSVPAYPTKASWNYDDKYVSSLTISGNSLRWVKNGSNNDLTIPYATNADTVDGYHESAFFRIRSGVLENSNADNISLLGGFLNATGNGSGNSNYPETYSDFFDFPIHYHTQFSCRSNFYWRTLSSNPAGNGVWRTLLDSYNSSVSLSGSTLTVKINGTEKSLTNTWRGMLNNLTTSSSSTSDSLSAYLGYLLANGSARDSTKLPLAGGTMTGHITMGGLAIYFGKSGNNAIMSYSSGYPNYGIWYNDAGVDTMTFSASNNANDATKADFAINGGGDGVLTSRGNKIWHAGNDGSGSGLDADLLDGNHASAFATSGHNHNSSYVSAVTISGNYLRVTKNGSNSDLTIPYATKAAQDNDGTALKGNYLRKVSVANNTANDFNTFENMTLTGRGDPTTGASLSHAPWTGSGPAGGYGVLTYLWSGYGIQMAWGYASNHIYIRNKYYNSGAVWSDSWSTVALTSDITKSAVGLGNVANYDQSKAIKSITRSGTTFTYTALDGTTGTFTLQDNNTTYNFSGTTFRSGYSSGEQHDCNSAWENGHYYYNANGPSGLGNSTSDGALYVQSYSSAWVGQIAQDYRNGRLWVRGKNNGTWQSWVRIANYNEIPSSLPANGGNADTVDNQHFKWSNDSNSPTYLWAANSSGTAFLCARGSMSVNYATSAGSATNASNLISNTRMDYGWSGINYFNHSAANQSKAKVNDTPYSSATWTHILRFNHANNAGYYTDLAIPFNGNGIYYKRVANGSLQNSTTNGGWISVLDNLNSSVSKSGETLTVKINGTSQSLTNTWRGIQNNLTSDSTTDSLSAKQGKALANGSARDNTKLPLAGGTLTGTISFKSAISADNQQIGSAIGIFGKYGYPETGDTGNNKGGIGFMFGRATTTDHDSLLGIFINADTSTDPYSTTGGLYITASTIKFRGNTVWHAGNDGSGSGLDADKLDGQHGSYYAAASSVTTLQGYFTSGIANRANKLAQSFSGVTSLASFTDSTDLIYMAAGEGNTIKDKPSGVDAFGVLSFKTASGYYGQILMDAGGVTYTRASNSLSGGWGQLAKTTDNVASATKLQTSCTLWGRSFDGSANVSGYMTNVGNITFTNKARIHQPDVSGNILYIGNESNNGWVMLADTCSQSGNDYWRLVANGTANFKNVGINIGATDPSYPLHVSGNVGASNFYTTSDRSKKQNISSFSEHIRKFQLKDTEKWHYGVIAQEVEEMFRDGEEGNMTVNYNSVLSYYVGQLENRVKELEDRLKKYEDEVKKC